MDIGQMSPQAMDRSIAATTTGFTSAERRRVLLGSLLFGLLALAAALAPTLRSGSLAARSSAPERSLERAGLAALTPTARAEVSARLGADLSAFHVTGAGTRLHAVNAPQGFRASFGETGIGVRARGIDVSLSLRAVGFGAAGAAVAQGAPTAHANRVSYARGNGVTEWYANGPAGIEQGFTLAHAPVAASASSPAPTSTPTSTSALPSIATSAPLTLTLALSGGARATVARGGQSVELRNGAASLRYGGLVAADASGHKLRSWLASGPGGGLLLRVAATGASYPLRIDPLIQAGAKLTGGGEQGEGAFGTSVALSADGATMLVGAPRDTNTAHGAAWVFTRSGSEWVQRGAKLTGVGAPEAGGEEQCAEESPEEAGECAFGASVALSADGSTALIGEPSATSVPGNAWVFVREETPTGPEWARSAVLSGAGGSGEGRFGKSVALSADGATALIGDPSATGQRGEAWVFTHAGSSWERQTTLMDPEAGHFDHFGRAVALSENGDTALIGSPGDSSFMGVALTYTRAGVSWTQTQELQGAGELGEGHFGKSVALSADGETALVGAMNDNGGRGAAWVFDSLEQPGEKLLGAAEGEPRFGYSVALSGDGETALIGAPHAADGGSVTQLTRSGSTWTRLSEQLAGSEASGKGWLGASLSLSGDGKAAAVGAPHDLGRIGAAWAFAEPPVVVVPMPAIATVTPGSGPVGATVKVKGSGFAGATAVSFGTVSATKFFVRSAILIEAVVPPGEGTIDVRVQTAGGTSPIVAGDSFRYSTGKAEHGGSENGNPEHGGGGGGGTGGEAGTGGGGSTGTGTITTTTTAGGGAGKTPAGGVLGTTSTASTTCQVSLRNKHLAVTSSRLVALRLVRTGAGMCSGKLTLNFNLGHRGKRAKLKPIGTASFAIASGTSKVFKITLNKAGRALFRAHHGRLNVSLSIVRAVPAPRLARTASVRLTWKKAANR